MPTSRSVIIGSPHTLMAEGMDRLLREAGYSRITTCDDPALLLEKVERDGAGVALLDMSFLKPDMELVVKLTAAQCNVVILFDIRHANLLREAILAGAKGCISIDITPGQFVESLNLTAQGAIVLSAGTGQLLLNHTAKAEQTETQEPLTHREQELAVLVARGDSNREIADALSISQHTVKVHLGNIRTKLDMRNRQELAAYVARHGMLEDIPIE